MGCKYNGWSNAYAWTWRRACDNGLATGHLGCGYSHYRTGDMAVAASGDIAPGSADRNSALASNKARNHFKLYIGDSFFLLFGKSADIVV